MKHGLQNLKIATLALLTAVLLLLTVWQALPQKESGLLAKESFSVSSTLISVSSKQYSTQVSGAVANETEQTVKISSLKLTVSDGKAEKEISLDGFILPAHAEKYVFYTEEGTEEWIAVKKAVAVVDGEELLIKDPSASSSLGGFFWISAILTLTSGFFLVQSCMVRYYMAQEDAVEKKGK